MVQFRVKLSGQESFKMEKVYVLSIVSLNLTV
jgi:hypothetical protein